MIAHCGSQKMDRRTFPSIQELVKLYFAGIDTLATIVYQVEDGDFDYRERQVKDVQLMKSGTPVLLFTAEDTGLLLFITIHPDSLIDFDREYDLGEGKFATALSFTWSSSHSGQSNFVRLIKENEPVSDNE